MVARLCESWLPVIGFPTSESGEGMTGFKGVVTMPIHYRMNDALSEAHLMACTQKKADIAALLLKAMELEAATYGKVTDDKRGGVSLLEVAQERQAGLAEPVAG